MADSIRLGLRVVLGAMLAVACGNGDDLDVAASDGIEPEPVDVGPARPNPADVTDPADIGAAGAGQGGGATDLPDEPAPDVDPNVCRTPNGVSGSPATLNEAIILMNSLPRPTTLACFLESLDRPLSVYMTSSALSLQPSPGGRSPRTFIVNGQLVMSIVFDGAAMIALELGYRTTPSRSIKTEILFPLEKDVSYSNFFDEVQNGASTKCGACHTGEVQTTRADFPADVFESDIILPYDTYEVDPNGLRVEREACDEAVEPERCRMLAAFFDHGEVVAAPSGIVIEF